MAGKDNKKKSDRSGIIAILIVVFILVCGVALTVSFIEDGSVLINRNEVSVSVGMENSKTFNVKMSFEGKIQEMNSMNSLEYEQIVSDVLNSIGYEKLTSDKSMEYVKEAMKEKLADKFKDKDFELQDIYIDKMMEVKYPTGESNRSKNPNNPTSSNITDMFKTR